MEFRQIFYFPFNEAMIRRKWYLKSKELCFQTNQVTFLRKNNVMYLIPLQGIYRMVPDFKNIYLGKINSAEIKQLENSEKWIKLKINKNENEMLEKKHVYNISRDIKHFCKINHVFLILNRHQAKIKCSKLTKIMTRNKIRGLYNLQQEVLQIMKQTLVLNLEEIAFLVRIHLDQKKERAKLLQSLVKVCHLIAGRWVFKSELLCKNSNFWCFKRNCLLELLVKYGGYVDQSEFAIHTLLTENEISSNELETILELLQSLCIVSPEHNDASLWCLKSKQTNNMPWLHEIEICTIEAFETMHNRQKQLRKLWKIKQINFA